jgi:hypothetical protein
MKMTRLYLIETEQIFMQRIKINRLAECQAGVSRLGILLLVLIISCGVFVGSQVFPFYYYYWEVQGLMEAQANKASVFTDREIRQTLTEALRKLEINMEDDDLKINRVGGRIYIELAYEEVLYVDFGEGRDYDLHVFEFNPNANAPFTK